VPNGGRGKRISDAALQQLSNFGFPGNAAAGEHCHWLSVMARQVGGARFAPRCWNVPEALRLAAARTCHAVCRCVRAYQHLLQSDLWMRVRPLASGYSVHQPCMPLTPPGRFSGVAQRRAGARRTRSDSVGWFAEHVHFRSSSHRSSRSRQLLETVWKPGPGPCWRRVALTCGMFILESRLG
jgi:hypothetical protein